MKICYLILAHNNFEHLDRLTNALDGDNVTSFYLHLDQKVKTSYNPHNPKVSVIPQRFDINWGGFNMVSATISLLKFGIEHALDADYFIFISGVDYPVRSAQYLSDLLTDKKEYIDLAPVPMPYKPIERYEYYYFEYNRRDIKFYNLLFLMEVLMKKLKIKRKVPFQIFAGTQWFALSRDCVKYILETIDKDNRYENFFRHSLVPDEAFFQTIIGNSPFAANTMTSLVYTDWNVPIPPARIEDRHIDYLEKNEGFNTEYGYCRPYFARKFDNDSLSIIERIEAELRK